MKNADKHEYVEKFLFRTRVHTLSDAGIRTRQDDFFMASDILTKFENLGHHLQYKSDLQLSHVFIALVFLILGIKGLMKDPHDSPLFAISIILIFSALYWIVSILFNLKHIGSFYFSNTTEKSQGAFEIKSGYPASTELESFLHEIGIRQKGLAIENLLVCIDAGSTVDEIERHAIYIRNSFSMTDGEFNLLMESIKQKLDKYSKS